MKKLTEIEAIRGLAALYVFLHHLNPLRGTRIESLFHFGQEAVILFFLISGFVIYYSTTQNSQKQTIGEYAKKRLIRIYPIFLISLVFAALAAFATHDQACINAPSLIGNLLMLQDASSLKPGVIVDAFCRNSPLWSLSYEAWFYTAFAVIFFLLPYNWISYRSVAFTTSLIGAVTYIIHPNAISLFAGYFIIWWAGVELAHEYRLTGRCSIKNQLPVIAVILFCTAIWLYAVIKAISAHVHVTSGVSPGLEVRHFSVALLAVVIACLNVRLPDLARPAINAFASAAAISYGLYVSHVPVILLVHTLGLPRSAEVLVCIIAALALAYVLECVLQPIVVRYVKGRSVDPAPAS